MPKKLKGDLTWSFGLCPRQAPASCFGRWWEAGVQQETGCFSLFELLKDEHRKKRRISWKHNRRIFYQDILKLGGERSHLYSCLWSVWGRDCKVHCSVPPLLFWLLELFHGPLLICSVLYGGAEEHSPRWLLRHRNPSLSFVSPNPLVSFRLSPLNVFDLEKKKW